MILAKQTFQTVSCNEILGQIGKRLNTALKTVYQLQIETLQLVSPILYPNVLKQNSSSFESFSFLETFGVFLATMSFFRAMFVKLSMQTLGSRISFKETILAPSLQTGCPIHSSCFVLVVFFELFHERQFIINITTFYWSESQSFRQFD